MGLQDLVRKFEEWCIKHGGRLRIAGKHVAECWLPTSTTLAVVVRELDGRTRVSVEAPDLSLSFDVEKLDFLVEPSARSHSYIHSFGEKVSSVVEARASRIELELFEDYARLRIS